MDNTSQCSEGDLSADNLVSVTKPAKPRKRSLVERELETNLTARITSPISNGDVSCYQTSRYGRARKLKRDTEFCDNNRTKTHKSPKVDTSPVKCSSSSIKMFASNSPNKNDPKATDLVSPIEHNENISTSVHEDSQEKPNSPQKKPKIYVRKDVIQRKDKEETATLLMNMFSPSKSSSKSNSTLSSEKSTEKYSLSTNIPTNGHLDNSGVVKILNFDNIKQSNGNNMSKKMTLQEIADLEKACAYDVGDLAWARIGTYPFWPCIITRDPYSDMAIKKKAMGRIERNFVHVIFFGDNGRRGWVPENMLRQYLGQAEFEVARERFTPEDKKKDPKLYAAFFVSEKKQHKWNISVEEAESFLRETKDKRLDLLYDMLIKIKGPKTTPKRDKVRKDSDVSLSESLYDTLFSEDDTKIDDTERHGNRKKSLNVSEVVTACLDDMAAKTGITNIKKQSHMDRWLQKAKSKTPEKVNESQIASKKDSSKKTKKNKSQNKLTQSNLYMNKKFSIINLNNSLSQNVTYNKINKRSQNGLMWFSKDFPENKKTKITLNGHSHCNGENTARNCTNTETHDINYSSEDSCQQSSKQFSSDNGDSSIVNGSISPVFSPEVSDEDDFKSKFVNESTEHEDMTHQPICNGEKTTVSDVQIVNVFSVAEEEENIPFKRNDTNNKINKTGTIQETGIKKEINGTETHFRNKDVSENQIIEKIDENRFLCDSDVLTKNTIDKVNYCKPEINVTVDIVPEIKYSEGEILADDNLNSGLSNVYPNSINKKIPESLDVNTSQECSSFKNRNFFNESFVIEKNELKDEAINPESPDKTTANQNIFQNNQIVENNYSKDAIKVFEISKATEVNKEVSDCFQEDNVDISNDFRCYKYKQISDSEDPKISENIVCVEMPTDKNHLGDNQCNEMPTDSNHLGDNQCNEVASDSNHLGDNERNEMPTDSNHLGDNQCNEMPTDSNHLGDNQCNEVASDSNHLGDNERNEMPTNSNHLCENQRNEMSTDSNHFSDNQGNEMATDSNHLGDNQCNDMATDSNHLGDNQRNEMPTDSNHFSDNQRNEMPTDSNHLGDNQVGPEDEIPISERVSHIRFKNEHLGDNQVSSEDEIPISERVSRIRFKNEHLSDNQVGSEDEIPISERVSRIPFKNEHLGDNQVGSEDEIPISERVSRIPFKNEHLGDNQVSSEDEIPISERFSRIRFKNERSSKLVPSSETNNVADKYEKFNRSYDDPEFVKYLKDSQDAIMEEHPHLTHNEIVAYLYRTWIFDQNQKPECVINDTTAHLEIKGLAETSTPTQPKKYKKRKIEKEPRVLIENLNIEKAEREMRKKFVKPFYNEAEDTDTDSDLESKKVHNSSPTSANNQQDLSTKDFPEEEFIDEIDFYFEQLANHKPNVFKGFIREKVCEVCEKPGSLIKCSGPCGGFFHIDCAKKEIEAKAQQMVHRGRKKKKPRGRKSNNESKVNGTDSESQEDKSQDISFEELAKLEFRFELEINEDDFDSKTGSQLMELMKSSQDDSEYYSNDEWDFEDIVAGKCKIVDVKIRRVSDSSPDADFKCNTCLKYDTPLCFVCKSALSPKTKTEFRQRCNVARCQKYYHFECLEHWPQAHFNSGEPSKTKQKISAHFETLTCPRHVCHTCVSDDPRGCQTRFNGDKLARCVRCPAVYHSFTKCLPAGSLVLNASNIVCTRHREGFGKVPSHVNTSWCFLCAEGGSLICCEYCPTSFHPECLKFKPPEDGYMCEDCETGRLPLYGEMVWAKLGHFRWWPGLILHPSEVPEKIMLTKHCTPGEFVVRFFGQYDHYWMNRGRVFRFQEGDSGRISGQKSKIDDDFMKAVEHAQKAFEILKNVPPKFDEEMEIEASLLPPQYVKLKVNKPVGGAIRSKDTTEANSMTQCECDPNDFEPCGPESECLNRMLLTECGPGCRAGERCFNRNFEKRIYPKLVPYRTSHRGWGLKTLQDIRKGQFVIEYVGELIDEEEFRRRMRRKHEIRDENFYFLTLDKDRMIDAGPKGNLARFMNHCCEPNCETQKWTVLGDVRVGLFAIDDIKAHTEVTFNYNLECAGIEKKQCVCGAPRCSGYIGAKPKQVESQLKKKGVTKRVYNKKKKSDIVTKPPPKPKAKNQKPKPKELTEIEKDLLIIRNASDLCANDTESKVERNAEKDSAAAKDGKNQKASKRKRVSFSMEEVIIIDDDVPKPPNVKKLRLEEPLDDTPITI